jgi:hypothetical protein
MSRQSNNSARKLRSALRRSCAAPTVTAPAQKKPPVNNFYARVSDGYVRGTCHQRPAPGVAQADRDEIVARQEQEAKAVAEREEKQQAVRETPQQMIKRPEETMQANRPMSTARRVMLGAAMLGMMATPPPNRRS